MLKFSGLLAMFAGCVIICFFGRELYLNWRDDWTSSLWRRIKAQLFTIGVVIIGIALVSVGAAIIVGE